MPDTAAERAPGPDYRAPAEIKGPPLQSLTNARELSVPD